MSESDEAFFKRMDYEFSRFVSGVSNPDSKRLLSLARRGLTARDEALEEAAKVADGYHARALEWAKTVRGLEQHISETDSSRIAADIRNLKDKP